MEIALGTIAYGLIMFFMSVISFFIIEGSKPQAILTLLLLMLIITITQL